MLSLDLDPNESQPMKLIILLIIINIMSITGHVSCAKQECSGPSFLHRGDGEGVRSKLRSWKQGRLPGGGGIGGGARAESAVGLRDLVGRGGA